jgi:S-adenosylmethionine:tRNA ribosyltransferase-isomerase
MHPSSLQIKDFTYDLPEEKIASYPLPQRDQSKLLIYKNGNLSEDTYQHLEQHVPEHSLLVFNQTKVIHARLLFQKPTGGKIEVFCLEPDERYPDVQTAMLQKGSVYWKCMVGGAAKWKDGQQLSLEAASDKSSEVLTMTAVIEDRREGYFVLQLNWDTDLSFAEALHIAGHVPLPPYLNRVAELSDETRYQTIFAREEGSVAAPTAALHFTEDVLNKLTDKDIDTGFVTLHVGAGTFKPVKSETMQDHDMHAEWIEVTSGFLQQIIDQLQSQKPVIAVGTTSARTLESLYWIGVRLKRNDIGHLDGVAVPQWYPYDSNSDFTAIEIFEFLKLYMHNHQMNKLITRTQIIIAPGYTFRVISGLVTNFHQPQSTLLLLVSALVGNAWRSIYDYALLHDFRFLSYGDGCLLWNNNA